MNTIKIYNSDHKNRKSKTQEEQQCEQEYKKEYEKNRPDYDDDISNMKCVLKLKDPIMYYIIAKMSISNNYRPKDTNMIVKRELCNMENYYPILIKNININAPKSNIAHKQCNNKNKLIAEIFNTNINDNDVDINKIKNDIIDPSTKYNFNKDFSTKKRLDRSREIDQIENIHQNMYIEGLNTPKMQAHEECYDNLHKNINNNKKKNKNFKKQIDDEEVFLWSFAYYNHKNANIVQANTAKSNFDFKYIRSLESIKYDFPKIYIMCTESQLPNWISEHDVLEIETHIENVNNNINLIFNNYQYNLTYSGKIDNIGIYMQKNNSITSELITSTNY